jgi:hypothetical protein
MKFKAKLFTPFCVLDRSKNIDTTLEFTKTQIVFPKSLTNGAFEEGNIKHGVRYELIFKDDIDRRMKYEIKLNNQQTIRLILDRKNERKLKWVHKMYRIQKEPLAFITIIISILTLFATIIFGFLQLA